MHKTTCKNLRRQDPQQDPQQKRRCVGGTRSPYGAGAQPGGLAAHGILKQKIPFSPQTPYNL
nr:MAG TPA: hypothetical protein [Caudoviricetes sp.]